MRLTGLEPVTSALSGQRSNRLSYRRMVLGTEEARYYSEARGFKSIDWRSSGFETLVPRSSASANSGH